MLFRKNLKRNRKNRRRRIRRRREGRGRRKILEVCIIMCIGRNQSRRS